MFGAYQAGVWDVLQPVFRPDMVIGCSAGSINGWAIASGISGEELIRTWLDPRCATLMQRHAARRAWQAFFDPGPLSEMLQELTSRYTPHIPFALTVTSLPRLRLEMVQTPEITWRHIAASCAIPVGYPAVPIGGKQYCDGGLLNVMPLWAAPRLGAQRAIAVNVLPSRSLTLARAAVRMVRLLAPREPQANGLEVLPVIPEPPLGPLRDALVWDPANIRRWIERGQADGRALADSPQFAAIADRFV